MVTKDGASPSYGQGAAWSGDDPEERARAIEAAFDYRGDVTIGLRDGSTFTGYLANRDLRAREPFVDVFPSDQGPRRRIPCVEIAALSFSGKDTASGKSWETWLERWNAKKAAEARGESVGDISLYPDPLDASHAD